MTNTPERQAKAALKAQPAKRTVIVKAAVRLIARLRHLDGWQQFSAIPIFQPG